MIGFIGAGNMGGAIIGGILKSGIADAGELIITDKSEECLAEYKRQGINAPTDANRTVAERADILILAVKPNVIFSVIDEIKDAVKDDALIISIAAGRSIKSIEDAFQRRIKLVRVMPNTPALVGEGMAAISPNEVMKKAEYADELQKAVDIFASFGKAEVVEERLMDAVTAVSGSSPAYVFMFIEAMADAAVIEGMPRAQAYTFAAQSVLGSAKMVLETKKHPGELKDMVCSPAGTTIEAVKVLEEKGMRAAVMDAMTACAQKSRGI